MKISLLLIFEKIKLKEKIERDVDQEYFIVRKGIYIYIYVYVFKGLSFYLLIYLFL